MGKIREHRDKLVIGNKLGRQIFELSQLTPWKVKVYHGISSLTYNLPVYCACTPAYAYGL